MAQEPALRGVHLLKNPNFLGHMPFPSRISSLFRSEKVAGAIGEIRSWPAYQPTPLHSLAGLAADLGVGAIHYKDESGRFGLESFKALGGAYAVLCLLRRLDDESGGPGLSFDALAGRARREGRADVMVCCATDGNHGRSVAWGAEMFGIGCTIFLHAGVSRAREEAIARYGADIVRVAGTYDDSVREAALQAEAKGWHVIADTSYGDYSEVPLDVMHGYTVMVEEALAALPAVPTHIFVQGGVGALAATVAAHVWERLDEAFPGIVVVEPDLAPCLYLTARAGHPVSVAGDLDTIMAGLACGEVSDLAWQILEVGASNFMCITDGDAAIAMRALAEGVSGDPSIVAGESGAAGIAGLMAAATRAELRQALQLGPDSHVLVFGTEGATDRESYQRIVGA